MTPELQNLIRERDEAQKQQQIAHEYAENLCDEKNRLTRELAAARAAIRANDENDIEETQAAEIASLTRERDGARTAFDNCHEHLMARTRELEAERAGAAAMREVLQDAVEDCKCSIRERDSGHLVGCFVPGAMGALSSTAGAKTLERLKEGREAAAWAYQLAGALELPVYVLDNMSAIANREKPPHDWTYPVDTGERLETITLARDIIVAERDTALERLRKAEAERDKFASCWTKAETAFNDMEIAKNERIVVAILKERITTLEAALVSANNNNLKLMAEVAEMEAALEEARKAFSLITSRLRAIRATQSLFEALNCADQVADVADAAHERIGRLMPEGKP